MQQSNQQIPEQNYSRLYIAIAFSLGAGIILLSVVFVLLPKRPRISRITEQTSLPYQSQNTAMQQSSQSSLQKQLQQVTPVPIQNKQGLQAIAQTLDQASTTQITTALDQNSQDTSNFNQ